MSKQNCSVDNKIKLMKELEDIYVNKIRHPLVGRSRMETDTFNEILNYLGRLENIKTKYEDVVNDYSSPIIDNKSFVYLGQGSINVMAGKDDKVRIKPTLFSSLDFVMENDPGLENKLVKDADKVFIVEGKLKEEVVKIFNTIENFLKSNGAALKVKNREFAFDKDTGTIKGISEEKIKSIIKANPGLGLLLGKADKGTLKVNIGAVAALVTGTYETLGTTASSLHGFHDDERIGEIVGIPHSQVNEYLRHRFSMGGVNTGTFADSVGRQVANNLGLSVNKDVAQVQSKKLISSLGLIALASLDTNKEIIEPLTINTRDILEGMKSELPEGVNIEALHEYLSSPSSTVAMNPLKKVSLNDLKEVLGTTDDEVAKNFRTAFYNKISISTKGIIFEDLYRKVPENQIKNYRVSYQYVILKGGKDTLNKIKSTLSSLGGLIAPDSRVREPVFEKPEGRIHTKRRDSLSELSAKQLEYLNTAESIPYEFNSGMVYLENFMKDLDNEGKIALLKKALAYPEIREDTSLETREANGSRQARIDRLIEDVMGLYEESKAQGKPFYFHYFMPSNNRAMIDSAGVNVMTDKEMARWLVSQVVTDGNKREFGKKDLDDLLNKKELTSEEAVKLNPHLLATMIGAVQAFDGQTVGGTKIADVEKGVINDVFESFKAIMKADIKTLEDITFNGKGHLGHKLTVLPVSKAYKEGADTVPTDVVYEVDGLTNALFYRLLQTPEGMSDKLMKVGVMPTQDDGISHMGDVRAREEGYSDNYLTLGNKFMNFVSTVVKNRNTTPKLKMLIDNDLFVVKDIENAVLNSKALRDFAKPGSMIINYGAGVWRITEQAIKDVIQGGNYIKEGILDKIVAVDNNGNYKISTEVLKGILEAKTDEEVDKFREDIRTKTNEQVMRNPLYRSLRESVMVGIGAMDEDNKPIGPLPDALNEVYKKELVISSTLTGLYNNMYKAFNKKLMNAVNGNVLSVSKEKLEEILNNLRDVIPSIARPDTPVVNSYTTILGRGVKNIEEAKDEAGTIRPSTMTSARFIGLNPTNAAMESIAVSLLSEKPSEPSAKGLPFTTHTQDNLDAISTVLDVHKEFGSFINQIFDALILDGNSIGASKVHNENATIGNLRYSSFEDSYMRLKDLQPLIMSSLDKKERELAGANFEALEGLYRNIVSTRSQVFGQNLSVMQMSGIVNSRFDYDNVKQLNVEEKRLIKAQEELTDYIKTEEFTKLDDKLKKVVTEINNVGTNVDGSLTIGVYDAAWAGLENGKLADILQVIRESDTAIRTIAGIGLEGRFVPGLEASRRNITVDDIRKNKKSKEDIVTFREEYEKAVMSIPLDPEDEAAIDAIIKLRNSKKDSDFFNKELKNPVDGISDIVGLVNDLIGKHKSKNLEVQEVFTDINVESLRPIKDKDAANEVREAFDYTLGSLEFKLQEYKFKNSEEGKTAYATFTEKFGGKYNEIKEEQKTEVVQEPESIVATEPDFESIKESINSLKPSVAKAVKDQLKAVIESDKTQQYSTKLKELLEGCK